MAIKHATNTDHRGNAIQAWEQATSDSHRARVYRPEELIGVVRRRAAAIHAMRDAAMSWCDMRRETGLHRERLEQILRTADLYD